MEALWRLRDPNLATVVGGELVEEPLFVVLEYSALGDLNQFLQDHVADTTAHLPPSAKTLRLEIRNIVLKVTQTPVTYDLQLIWGLMYILNICKHETFLFSGETKDLFIILSLNDV